MRRIPGLRRLSILVLLAVIAPFAIRGGWLESVGNLASDFTSVGFYVDAHDLTGWEVERGLKQALYTAADEATKALGREGGYLNHPEVRIPMPESMSRAGELARSIRRGDLVEEFIASMNRAAEGAAKGMLTVLSGAVKGLIFPAPRAILGGPKDAATRYFERTTFDGLAERIRPIVEDATNREGVAHHYRALLAGLSEFAPLTQIEMQDLDGYVARRALAGVFTIMAREERRIRDDPMARSTKLMRKIFRAVDE